MAHEVAIPKLGLTMVDCTLTGWSKADGDRVEKGEVLFEIETDKITSEVEADAAGYLRRFAEVDTMHTVGAVIGGLYETRNAALAATGVVAVALEAVEAEPVEAAHVVVPAAAAAGRLRVSPLARRIAKGAGIDPGGLTGTGARGAVLRRDVDAAIAGRAMVAGPGPKRRPLAGLRKTIARNMMQSLQMSAQMTAFARVDMAEAVALRTSCVANEAELGVRVSFTDIVLKACAVVLSSI